MTAPKAEPNVLTDSRQGTDAAAPNDRTWVESATILRCEVGSSLHGIADGTPSDRDEMGVCLEPYQACVGLRWQFEQHVHRTAAAREGRHDAPSQPGDLDLTIYSLRKWARLALDGNPSVLLLLFAPDSHTVKCDTRGQALRDLAPAFASRQAGRRFLGYLQAQRQRLLGERGQKNVNRQDLVDRHGFDTKYAGHMMRLGVQGIEFLETGRLTLPMADQWRLRVLAVRQGQVALNDVLTQCGEVEQRLKDLITTSPLPDEPDYATVEQWVLETYWQHWQATYGHALVLETNRKWADRRANG